MTEADVSIAIVSPANTAILDRLASGVFDRPINPRLCREFLADPRHHLAVAIHSGTVVGMASAVHYVHPDKEPQLWINEVGVHAAHQQRGLGKLLVEAMLTIARNLHCTEAWVLTDRSNVPAMRLYAACGGTEAPPDQVMFTFKL